ncbi:unnamed protein product, partial [Rotaria sordida]
MNKRFDRAYQVVPNRQMEQLERVPGRLLASFTMS